LQDHGRTVVQNQARVETYSAATYLTGKWLGD